MKSIPTIILEQLGGNKFIAMTGTKDFVGDHNTLRMTLAKNASKANRLWVTLDDDDTYTMNFFKYTPGRLSKKTWTFTEDKKVDVYTVSGIYFDQLQEIFTEVTHLYTHF